MSLMKHDRKRERVALPWERPQRPWRRLLRAAHIRSLLAWALLAGLAFGVYEYALRTRLERDTTVAIAQTQQAIAQFRMDTGRCPDSASELVHPPISHKRYLRAVPRDAWNRPLRIQCPGYFEDEADVISAGPSGSLLTDDNIQ